uniref:Spindle pole body component n=1 Tax=Echinococcus canadensis TaxID=519352 RepID=A0A915EXH1_9CEST
MDNRCGQKDRNVEQLICENALKYDSNLMCSTPDNSLESLRSAASKSDKRLSDPPLPIRGLPTYHCFFDKAIGGICGVIGMDSSNGLLQLVNRVQVYLQVHHNPFVTDLLNRKLLNQLGGILEQFQAHFCLKHHQFSTFLFNKAMDLSSRLQAQVKMLLFQLTNLDLPGKFEESC